jgi:hypothetical protein
MTTIVDVQKIVKVLVGQYFLFESEKKNGSSFNFED